MNPHEGTTRILAGVIIPAVLAAGISVPGKAVAAAKMIGMVMPLCCDFGDPTKEKFLSYLQQVGMTSSEAELVVQRPGADKVSILNSIRKMVAYDASLLVVFGASAAKEAQTEAKGTPVVFVGAYDPLRENLVQQLEQPGMNATGVSCKTSLPFLLDNIQETLGTAGALGVVFHSDNADSAAQVSELRELAPKKGFRLLPADLKSTSAQAAAAAMAPAQFLYLAAGCYPDFIDQTMLLDMGKPIATQCQNIGALDTVFSLAADNDETLAEAAKITMRILRGEKPGQVPVASIKKINFVINLAAAQRLGLKIPFNVLSRATKVVK